MPKISNIIFCLGAQNTEGIGASANNILSVINPEYVPGLFSFSLIITILDIDCSIQHEFSIEFLSPSKDPVIEINSQTPILQDNSNLPTEFKGLNLAMDWNNVNFKTSGIYTLKIYIDGKFIKDKDIYVKGKNE